MPKHFFFDLDNTLTRSRYAVAPEHAAILKRLTEVADVIVVSGSGQDIIKKNLGPDLAGLYYILGQNGNRAEDKSGTVLWNRSLSPSQKEAIYAFIAKARAHLALTVKDENDIVEDRDSQIAFSLIGHHEDQLVKEAFDPDSKRRLQLLADLHEDVDALRRDHQIEISIGGKTNLDIYQLGKDKGHNVGELIKHLGWNTDECIYVGDALFPGGNDYTVVGVIPTHSVSDYTETYRYLASILAA
jgi:HAD superfamily hydrolase (TIGR01484 family)